MIAEKSVKELENSQLALTITVDAESIEKAYKERLAKYAKDLQMNGFRKGKAPLSVVESKVGEAVREESTFNTMEEALHEVIETLPAEEKPLPYSTPVLQNEEALLPFKKDESVTFTVHYDVMPKFDLPAYTGLTVDYTAAEVTDKDIEDRIEELREQNSVVKSKEGTVAEGDIVTCNYVELDKDGNEVPNTSRKDFTFTVGSSYNFYDFDKDIIGMAKDEEKKFEKSYPEDYSNPAYAGKTITLLVKVTEIKERELPAVDDEFAEDIKEEYKSVADLKAGIKAEYQAELDEHMKSDKIEALLDKILEKTTINVPESMVRAQCEANWRDYVRQTGLEEAQLLKYFELQGQSKENILAEMAESVKKNLKGQLLFEAIQKKENFPVDEAKKEERLKGLITPETKEESKKYYEDMINDELQYAEVMPFLLKNNTFKADKTLSFEEYHEQHHHHHDEENA